MSKNTDGDGGRTLWHGRFAGGPADALMAYTVSLPFDRELWRQDIAGPCTRAWPGRVVLRRGCDSSSCSARHRRVGVC